MANNYQEIMNTIDRQEKLLRPEHFSSEFALELGNTLLKLAKEKNAAMGFSIRKPNGSVLFQYLMDGCSALNAHNWLRRKAGMSVVWERSSLYMWAREQATGQTVQYNGLDPNECVQRGGGFPLFLKSGEFVAVISATGLQHYEDHQIIVDALAGMLGISDVPKADVE